MWKWIKQNKFIATSFLILGWLAHVLLETIVVNTLSAVFGLPPLKLA